MLASSLLLVSGCPSEGVGEARPPLQAEQPAVSTPAEARRLVREEGALLLDVRSVEEFEAGHVEGAIVVPHDELAGRLPEIDQRLAGDRTRPVVVYCRSGRRSSEAKATLEQAGFTQVIDLGAMSNWSEVDHAGGPASE